jgi:hypothetical protein
MTNEELGKLISKEIEEALDKSITVYFDALNAKRIAHANFRKLVAQLECDEKLAHEWVDGGSRERSVDICKHCGWEHVT